MKARYAYSVIVFMFLGCGGRSVEPAKPVSVTKTYPLTGEVLKVDVSAGRVTLRHDAIPGYMDAMSMPFRVAEKDHASLGDLQIGDKISATLVVTDDALEIKELSVTEMAAPPALKLDLSGGTATLRTKLEKLEPGAIVPDFGMTLQDGTSAKLSDFRGKVVALTFIYTRCPDPTFCPLMDSRFSEIAKLSSSIPARAELIRLLSVSFDSKHDTPEVLAKHARLKGAKSPVWQYAVAPYEELRKVAEPLGLTYGPRENDIIHSLSTAIIGRDGRLVKLYAGSDWTPEEVFKVIRSELPK